MKRFSAFCVFLLLASSCGSRNIGCVDRYNVYSDFSSLESDFRSSLNQENGKNDEPCMTKIFDPIAFSYPAEENRTYSLTGICCCKIRREGTFDKEKCPNLHYAEGAIFLGSEFGNVFINYFITPGLSSSSEVEFASSLDDEITLKKIKGNARAVVFKEEGERFPSNYPKDISRFRYSNGDEDAFSSRFYVLTESASKLPYASLLFSKKTSVDFAREYSQKFLADINQKLLS